VDVPKENTKTLLSLLAILLLAGLATWYVTNQRSVVVDDASPAAVSLGVNSTSTRYTDLAGNGVNLTQYLGRVIVVNSWASWSPASVAELQLLNKLSLQYSADQVQFLAINRSEPVGTAKSFLAAFGIGDTVTLVLDEPDYYYQSIGGFNMPETLVYDTKGNVIRHFRGPLSESAVRLAIDTNLVDNTP